jgi:hypothetical protein
LLSKSIRGGVYAEIYDDVQLEEQLSDHQPPVTSFEIWWRCHLEVSPEQKLHDIVLGAWAVFRCWFLRVQITYFGESS